MIEGLMSDVHAASNPRINGVTPAVVVNNIDAEGQGRVQVSFPWLPDVEPWARMCAPVAGSNAGIWAIPQIDDEVLVAFANGDVTQPYILGGLWSMTSPPPAPLPTDSTTKRVVRTPSGHSITLDDVPPAVTVEHLAGHKIEMTATSITISTAGDTASIALDVAGTIKIKGTLSVDVSAANVSVSADAAVKVKANASAELSASGPCTIGGAVVKIN